MHPQLSSVVNEFASGTARVRRLAEVVPADRWTVRPSPDRWSAAESVAHLNLTTDRFRPIVREGLERARSLRKGGKAAAATYHRGVLGSLLVWAIGRPGRFRTRTAPAFVPVAVTDVATLVAEFERRQEEQVAWVRAADGLPLDLVKVTSAFDSRVRYNLFAALSILARHQQRHLWQAEEAAAGR
jgi:hypothetical protein